MYQEVILSEPQKRILNEVQDLPEEIAENLIELIRIIKRTIQYQLDSEAKPIILGQFEALKEDWSAPGMEVYDDL